MSLLAITFVATVVAGIILVRQRIRTGSVFGNVRWTAHQDLRGKICVVTGSSSGIGEETARQLALMNARVILVLATCCHTLAN